MVGGHEGDMSKDGAIRESDLEARAAMACDDRANALRNQRKKRADMPLVEWVYAELVTEDRIPANATGEGCLGSRSKRT